MKNHVLKPHCDDAGCLRGTILGECLLCGKRSVSRHEPCNGCVHAGAEQVGLGRDPIRLLYWCATCGAFGRADERRTTVVWEMPAVRG